MELTNAEAKCLYEDLTFMLENLEEDDPEYFYSNEYVQEMRYRAKNLRKQLENEGIINEE